jgi:hypothetical protein
MKIRYMEVAPGETRKLSWGGGRSDYAAVNGKWIAARNLAELTSALPPHSVYGVHTSLSGLTGSMYIPVSYDPASEWRDIKGLHEVPSLPDDSGVRENYVLTRNGAYQCALGIQRYSCVVKPGDGYTEIGFVIHLAGDREGEYVSWEMFRYDQDDNSDEVSVIKQLSPFGKEEEIGILVRKDAAQVISEIPYGWHRISRLGEKHLMVQGLTRIRYGNIPAAEAVDQWVAAGGNPFSLKTPHCGVFLTLEALHQLQ